MSTSDRNGARTIALSPEDQERLFNLAGMYVQSAGELIAWSGDDDVPRLEAVQRVREGAEQAMALAEVVEATVSDVLVLSGRVRGFLHGALAEVRDDLAMAQGYLATVETGEDPFAAPPSIGSREVPLSTVRAELVDQIADEQANVELLLRLLGD
jgi:hypothetical protein